MLIVLINLATCIDCIWPEHGNEEVEEQHISNKKVGTQQPWHEPVIAVHIDIWIILAKSREYVQFLLSKLSLPETEYEHSYW